VTTTSERGSRRGNEHIQLKYMGNTRQWDLGQAARSPTARSQNGAGGVLTTKVKEARRNRFCILADMQSGHDHDKHGTPSETVQCTPRRVTRSTATAACRENPPIHPGPLRAKVNGSGTLVTRTRTLLVDIAHDRLVVTPQELRAHGAGNAANDGENSDADVAGTVTGMIR
jgi:hypothetical protein